MRLHGNTAQELLRDLRALGVVVWEDAGQLRYRAPEGALGAADLAVLRAAKADILDLLRAEANATGLVPDLDGRHEPFPLTDVQAAYLLGRSDAFGHGGVACHVYLEVSYPDLDPERVEQAWNQLIERHDMLRAIVDPTGFQQVLVRTPKFDVPCADLRGDDAARFSQALDAVREQMGHRVYETTRWPLFEIRLTRADARSVLHLSMDFLIADWASIWLLLKEFEALHADPTEELPTLDLSFRDYLLAERGLRESPAYLRDREYWWSRLDGLPEAPSLPLSDIQTELERPRFSRRFLRLDSERWDSLKRRAHQRGLTPSAVVLAAYAAVIERWSRPQFCLNLTVLNRLPLHSQVDALVGDFTSVSLLAVNWSADATFSQQAKALSERLFDDLDHRLCSGVEVMRELARRRGPASARMPIVFTSAIGLAETGRRASGRLDGRGITQTPQVLLDCQAMDDAEGLQVNWDVRDGSFPEGMADDMFAAFEQLLLALATQPQVWDAVDAVPLPAWQREERTRVNQTAAPLPNHRLHEPVLAQAARTPERTALFDVHGTLTYGELARRVAGVATALRESGCAPGDRVAIIMDKGVHQIVGVLGALAVGAVYVPIDSVQPERRRAVMLEDAGVKHVLTCSNVRMTWPESIHTLAVDSLPPRASFESDLDLDPDSPAYVIYTSGSTGKPKGVVISHRAAANTVVDINRRFEVDERDRVLSLAQLGFDLSVYDIFGPLSVGGSLVLPDPDRLTDPSHWAAIIAQHGVTLWNSVPALMQMLISYLQTAPQEELPSLRLALLSGDWIPLSLPDAVRVRLPGTRVISLGGATEAAIWSIYHPYQGLKPGWRSIPYGRPLANQGFRVLDRRLRDCPVWVPGELYITGHGLADGYLGDRETTASRFFPHPVEGQRLYRTGDWGRYTPGGEIEFLGREDAQVKIRGHRIELGEIEAALQDHPAVGRALAVVDTARSERDLFAVVETTRMDTSRSDSAQDVFQRTIAGVDTEAEAVLTELRRDDVEAAARHLDEAARLSMLRALLALGFFADGATHGADDIVQSASINPRFHWLVRRWVALLLEAGLLITESSGRLACLRSPDDEALGTAWQRAEATWSSLGSPTFIAYVRRSAELAADLLIGRVDPVNVLFPGGTSDHVRALYRDNAMARYLNCAVGTLLRRIAQAHTQGPLRVLEVGAGTGATTESALATLDSFSFEYLFTDAAAFFLPEARSRFAHLPQVRFGVYNVDDDYRAQGLSSNSFDVVLAAGVLENARDIPAALHRLRELTAPGGWLVLSEPTAEHAWILISQAFMMTEPGDTLRTRTSYLQRADWLELMAGAAREDVLCLPPPEHALAPQGLHLFATRVKADRRALTAAELRRFLTERLPQHMLPSHIEIVDALPLTENGKLDRRATSGLRPSLVQAPSTVEAADGTESELEKRLCSLWAAALGVSRVGRSQSFYDLGADSLIMARVAGRLREALTAEPYCLGEVTFDALLRQLVNQPTVAALAEFIEARSSRAAHTASPAPAPHEQAGHRSGASNGVLIPFGGGSDGPLRVVFHAGLGTMDCFRPLLAQLAAQKAGPILGIVIADSERYCALNPKDAVDRIADDYAERLTAEGHERVQLVGYCLGGLFATEVARRLSERGIHIEDLVLVSSHPVVFDVEDDLMIEALFVPNLHITLEQAGFGGVDGDHMVRGFMHVIERHGGRVPAGSLEKLGGDPVLDAVGGLFRRMTSFSREERFAAYVRAVAESASEPMPAEMALGLFKVFRQSFRAAHFTPPPYLGDIRFLRPKGASGFAPGMDRTTLEFWQRACLGEVSVIDIDGNHFTCIDEPHARRVAELIAAPLRKTSNTAAFELADAEGR